jgi:hypothetical protein
MKKSDKYPYRPYSNALTKGDDWIMQNMVVFLDNKGLPWAVTEYCHEYTVWVWGEAVTQNGSQSGNTEKMQGKIYMSGNDFERLLENWQAANRKRRAA